MNSYLQKEIEGINRRLFLSLRKTGFMKRSNQLEFN